MKKLEELNSDAPRTNEQNAVDHSCFPSSVPQQRLSDLNTTQDWEDCNENISPINTSLESSSNQQQLTEIKSKQPPAKPSDAFVENTLTASTSYNQINEKSTIKRPTLDRMFASTSQRNDDGLRASYNISLLIAKSGKPHTIGEKLILPAVEEVLKTVLHKPASDIIKRIPLSNNTVEIRIDEMSSDIESFLCNYLQTTHFSIQLDESTLPDNAALLLAYVRFIMNQEIYEELLFARTLITDTKEFLDTKDKILKENLMKRKTDCQEDDVSTYVQHLNALYSDFESRFEDILTMVIPPWIINPYGDIEETNVIIQEELTELSTNEELTVQFKNGYQQFWLQNNIPVTYPVLWNIAREFLIFFPSSYLVDAVTNLLTKKRNRHH
ncbi:unnamed protein product [Acanthoscelides obtectus]|uniref:Zinc finger BED domain-containing protein 5 n=1 Tax=Acanthoscelides obtectus TaxID=200917 RepID=A0A9P0PS90_ACAOB|nr:unnamed protein product [Acanthoscelides obtectus]CAK1650247.1 SCAN domain-containing protein 3 [Acanthoscelides obtectus]